MSELRASAPSTAQDIATARAAYLAPWRRRILQSTLTATAVLASIAYVPGMWAAYSSGLRVLMAVDTLLWGVVVALTLWRRGPFRIRAMGFISGWYVLAALLRWVVGTQGSSVAWLLSVPVLSALFFGHRGAVAGVGLVMLAAAMFWILLDVHQSGRYLAAGGSYSSEAWIATASSLTFLSALLAVSIARLLRGLEDSLVELELAHREMSDTLSERERLQGELLRSQKQSALGTLASGIAHDFNNILVPILMASEEARDEAPPDSQQRQNLDRVISAALRARNLIRRILDFSRSSDVARSPIALEPIVREAGALLRSSAPAGISIEYRLDAPDAHIMADPGEMHQILMNLGTNACLAMKQDGGRLTLAVDREAGRVRLTVEDTGPGIPRDLQDRIFDPFFTTRESGAGTGLGLAIVHRLVDTMTGDITLDSEPGHGTRFVLTFPEVAATAEVTEPVPLQPPVANAGQAPDRAKTVLVVDDEELVRGMISAILTKSGYVVHQAASPESALRRVHDDPHAIDLVITDQAMPYLTGLELARDIRSLRPDLPIILVSGHLNAEELAQAGALGVNAVLEKPFTRRTLLEQVGPALGLEAGAQD